MAFVHFPSFRQCDTDAVCCAIAMLHAADREVMVQGALELSTDSPARRNDRRTRRSDSVIFDTRRAHARKGGQEGVVRFEGGRTGLVFYHFMVF